MTEILYDTSVVIAITTGELSTVPDPAAYPVVSAVTLAGLHHGVLVAVRAQLGRRLAALQFAQRNCVVLPVDEPVAEAYGRVAADARRVRGRRIASADGLIAATAAVHGIKLYTRDADFAGLPGLDVTVL